MAGKPWFKFWDEVYEAIAPLDPVAFKFAVVMLRLMHKSGRRGYALIGDAPATAMQIASRSGLTDCVPGQASHLCNVVLDTGIVRALPDGTFYSPRMVKDVQEENTRSENGRKGGNPRLRQPPSNHLPTTHQPTSNHSLSLSPSDSQSQSPEGGVGETERPQHHPPGQIRSDVFDLDPPVMSRWLAPAKRVLGLYPRQMGGRAAVSAFAVALQAISDRGVSDPEAWLSASVRAFGEAVKGKAPDFIPSPVNWALDGRYDDDHAKAYGSEPTQAEMSADLLAALEAGRKK